MSEFLEHLSFEYTTLQLPSGLLWGVGGELPEKTIYLTCKMWVGREFFNEQLLVPVWQWEKKYPHSF